MPGAAPHVLLVEDDDVDVMVVTRVFKKMQLPNTLTVARDGIEALELLRGTNGAQPVPKPYVILLDLNLPRMNGFEFLEELRRDPEHGAAVVFVLTTSDSERDKAAAYAHRIAGYAVKADIQRYRDIADLLGAYNRAIELPG
jgi:CheY-like chemotaxis protein